MIRPPSLATVESGCERKPTVRLEACTFAKLEGLARSKGVPISQMIDLLIESESRRPVRANEPSQSLSPKQKQVLECLKNGVSVKEIADQFGVKEETVRTHILRLRSHLGCSDLLSLRFQRQVTGNHPACNRFRDNPHLPPADATC